VSAGPLAGVCGERVQNVQYLLRAPKDSALVNPCQLHHASFGEHVHVPAYMRRPNPELLAQGLGVYHGLAYEEVCDLPRC